MQGIKIALCPREVEQWITFQKKIGHALGDVRDKVILATKTIRRDASGAVEQLDNSLCMMKTDYIDIYQLHQIAREKDWDSFAEDTLRPLRAAQGRELT